jgi:hypothetical protein
MYPSQAREWVFPADSASGHLAETKEDRSKLSKWGNELRQTFRTIATVAGVSEIDAKLLMNHSIPGVKRATLLGTSFLKTICATNNKRLAARFLWHSAPCLPKIRVLHTEQSLRSEIKRSAPTESRFLF